jgi:hypothetical protein
METLEKYFRTLTGASFAKRGRAAGDLLAQWPAIVGERIAAMAVPERIKWPRISGSDNQGGTLILRSAPGQALSLSYETELILERINAYLGYGAVAAVKVMPGHKALGKPERRRLPPLPQEKARALDEKLALIADERLKDALKRLGQGALAGPGSSPQDE